MNLLEYTYTIRYKKIVHKLEGTDLNNWYLESLIDWIDDYISNTLVSFYKERAIAIKEKLVVLLKKDIVIGTDITEQDIDTIIFMLLSRRNIWEEGRL